MLTLRYLVNYDLLEDENTFENFFKIQAFITKSSQNKSITLYGQFKAFQSKHCQ
jgi:hypothetical protein